MKHRSYVKVHTNQKAAEEHIRKIKARGGTVSKTVKKGKIIIKSHYK